MEINMLKKIITAFFIFTTTAYAQELTVGVPPGGATGRVAQLAADILGTTVNYAQNCSVVKYDIEVGKPTVYIQSAMGLHDDICKLNFNTNVTIADELFSYTYGLCYRRDRDLGWEYFENPSKRKTIATNIVNDAIVKKLVSGLKIMNFNTVVVGNTGKTREVILGNEFDYAVVDSEWIGKNIDKVNCLFIGSDYDSEINGNRFTSVYKMLQGKGTLEYPLLQDVFIIVAANLSVDQTRELQEKIIKLRHDYRWQLLVNSFGNSEVTSEQHKFQVISEQLR